MRECSSFTCGFLAASILLIPPVGAQSPTAAGVIVLADRAALGTVKLSNGTTVYSGDLLRTETGGRLQILVDKIRFTLAENSSARVFRSGSRIVFELERGSLAYATSGEVPSLELYALDIRFVPRTSNPSAGQVAVAGRCEVRVRATRGSIEVMSGNESKTIEERKSYRVTSEMGVDYRDSWVPVLKDYPDFAKDSDYHHSHGHSACVTAYNQSHGVAPSGHNSFDELATGTVISITGVVIYKALESPDRP